ncbi:MAG TPA: teichoic acid ABC transporter permease [Lachnospiraceae bacterium]|nr:teichoic acid ABC transporter permease [Lachnospiraceae bacterium]
MKINELYQFLLDVYARRRFIINLAKNDVKSRYAGSFFGIFWAFMQPLVTILVFWFVFQVGFKKSPVINIEFILWFVAAYIPWIYFSDGVISSANCFFEYSYLVKKMKFRTSILPIVKVLSATLIHLFFIIFVLLMYFIYGYKFEIIWLQTIYYSFCTFCLIIGISWIVSSISVFFKDFAQIVNIALQIGFWLTPIFWSPDSISESVLTVLKFNPMYYVVQGYRDCFITGIYFWQRGTINFYFWGVVCIVFVLGTVTFKRLRPHFADMI